MLEFTYLSHGDFDNPHAVFMKALEETMKDYGVKKVDSDAFDMSRDLILMDAAASIGATVSIIDNQDSTDVYVSFTDVPAWDWKF